MIRSGRSSVGATNGATAIENGKSHNADGDLKYHRKWRRAPTIPYRRALIDGGLLSGFFVALFLLGKFILSARSLEGPPSDLVVKGKRVIFTTVPPERYRTFYTENEKISFSIARAFRNRGWRKARSPAEAHIIYHYREDYDVMYKLEPWQRYNHMPGSEYWNEKDQFIEAFDKYQQKMIKENFDY